MRSTPVSACLLLALISLSEASSSEQLLKLIPGVKSPRRLNLSDIRTPEERAAFHRYGGTFAVQADLNFDGRAEMAQAAIDEEHRGLVVIWQKNGRRPELAFFRWFQQPLVVLRVVPHPDGRMADLGWLAISASGPLPTEDFVLIFWCDGRYHEVFGADLFYLESSDLRNIPGHQSGCSEALTRPAPSQK